MAGTVAVIVAVVGAVRTAYSAHQAAEDRDDAKDQLEKQARRDAEIHAEETERLTAKQKALYAASGVRVDEGSPLAVIAETQRKAEEERNAILQGYGYQGDRLSTEADRIRTTGAFSVAGTLLGGAATYAASPNAKNPFKTTTGFTDPGTYYKG